MTLISGDDDPTGWREAVREPDAGSLVVRPAGSHGDGGIQLDWVAGTLTVAVDSGAFP